MSSTPDDRSFEISSWLFLRGLGLVLLIAFVSLGVQAQGLFGSEGVSPIALFVQSAKRAGHGFWQHPSALWWSNGDGMISTIWTLGAAASTALLLGILPRAAMALAWFAYLSFVSLGWPFMSFQWDTLLLEVAFTAFFFAPWCFWHRLGKQSAPHPVARWALCWLLFRLLFRSAYVKLASGDPTWADLSALSYHYWTQPLPTTLGWYANLLPNWFQKLSGLLMFAIEFIAPLLIWVPRAWARRIAAVSITGLMLLIALTGNYGFFNLLTVVLCIPLLDDRLLGRFVPKRLLEKRERRGESKWSVWPAAAPAAVIAVSALIFFSGTLGQGMPRWLGPLYPFSTFNNYGLFAVMTTERLEIELEGTEDGVGWKPYLFRYKPGPVDRAPVWVAPHQPRLDWQIWFAALGDYRRNPWLGNLMKRMLQGEPSVLELLAENPFPDAPPKQMRALVYSYEPASPRELAETGSWWKRGEPALYAPILGVPIESTASTAE